MPRFSCLELRTTNLDDALAFYAHVLGLRAARDGAEGRLFSGDAPFAPVTVLPEEARRRGAPANWCGHLVVDDVDTLATRLVARGCERLGPTRTLGTGSTVVLLRAATGEPFAVASRGAFQAAESATVAAWHELHTTSLDASIAFYTEMFDWVEGHATDLGPALGRYVHVAFAPGEPVAAGMIGSAGKNGTSPHWESYFATPDLDGALTRVRASGGDVHLGPHTLGNGDRIAACHDAQGAAFGLVGRA